MDSKTFSTTNLVNLVINFIKYNGQMKNQTNHLFTYVFSELYTLT